MPTVTPGIDFIVAYSAKFLIPSLLTHTVLKTLSSKCNVEVSLWALLLASLSASPLIFTARVIKKEMQDRRIAAIHGARLVPRIQGKTFGNLDLVMVLKERWDTGYLSDTMDSYIKEYGPVVNARVFWHDYIITTCPEHIKLILSTDFSNYSKGRHFKGLMSSVFDTGMINEDGHMWKFQRTLNRPAFTRNRISDLEIFDKHATNVVSLLKRRFHTGHPIDLQDLMERFTMDSASDFLFGRCLDSLCANLPYAHNSLFTPPSETISCKAKQANAFSNAFAASLEIVSARVRLSWIWPLREILEDKTKKHVKVIRTYLDSIIQEAIKNKNDHSLSKVNENDGEFGIQGETLLDNLIKKIDDPIVLRNAVLTIMFGARDTTAATLTFFVYFLSMHPEVMVRLRKEILDKVGPTRCPNCDDIKDMKYLRAVIDETLRLFPSVPFSIREAISDTIWPSPIPGENPIFIPGGTFVAYSAFFMHRDKDIWGPDAEKFDPDRFLDERYQKYLQNNPFIFLPFSAGPRTCLGQQYAYNQMSVMIVRLLQNFSSITLDEEACPPEHRPRPEWKQGAAGRRNYERMWPRTHLTMYVAGGLWVTMKEASDDAEA